VAACDVLVVGAGPTGLVLALWLTKLGAKVRIVDKSDAPGTTSRALAVQARTLELYRQLDLADAVVKRAHKVPAINFWARGKREVRIPFEEVGAGWTRYPYLGSSRRTNTNACWSHGWRRRVFLSSVGPSWSNTRTRAIAL
jgi:2-polyprenyl-6-methoxyphenol hydroxylase-like FAD-dependent oxidoreductase